MTTCISHLQWGMYPEILRAHGTCRDMQGTTSRYFLHNRTACFFNAQRPASAIRWHLLSLCYMSCGNHLQRSQLSTVVQACVALPCHVVDSVPNRNHGLEPARHEPHPILSDCFKRKDFLMQFHTCRVGEHSHAVQGTELLYCARQWWENDVLIAEWDVLQSVGCCTCHCQL